MNGSRLFCSLILGSFLLITAATRVSAQDPLKVAPEMYKLLFENDRVRVMEVVFKPGSKIAKHSHPDHFVYATSGGKLKISTAEGANDAEIKPGDVMWIGAQTHWAENIGTNEVRLVVTELKEPAPAAAKAAVTPKAEVAPKVEAAPK
jgi:quercetin dioxygenase-like cupin family protein